MERINLSQKRLRDLMGRVYDASYFGSPEDRGEAVREVLAEAARGEPYRVYSTAELRTLPEGTAFDHSKLGRCRIGRSGVMVFAAGTSIGLTADVYPWNLPMQLVGPEE